MNEDTVIGFFIFFVIFLFVGGIIALSLFSFGWDTGMMSGKIIGYDSNLFGTKTVFVLEDKTVFNQNKEISQSEIRLCSDFDDTNIHKLIEDNLNKKVKIEYKERRVGFYSWKYCREAPITNISQLTEVQK